MAIETVIFDLDDTLVAESSAAMEAVVPWARQMQLAGSPVDLFMQWRSISSVYYKRYQSRQVSFHEQRRSRVREFLPHVDLRDDAVADRAFDGYLRRYEQAWRCFDDAIPCLRRLRAKGTTVGVLTNGEETHQSRKLDLVGLTGELDFFVASSALPAGKPDSRAFLAACRVAEVLPERCLMVGNDAHSDVAGAVDAGLHGLLLARSRGDESAKVTFIPGLEQLRPSTLQSFASSSRA